MLTSDGKKSVIILPILTVLATIFLVLRLIKRKRSKSIGADDWLLVFALFMLYLEDVGAFLLAVKGGEGKPIATLTEDELEWLFKMFFWPELGYTILIFTIKTSILLSLKRIFWRIQWFRVALCVLAALSMGWFIGVFFAVIFQCTPIDKAWNPSNPGHCINLMAFLWGNSISNNIIDWLILSLPVLPVLQLQMSRTQKAMVLGSFATGSIACIASLVRAATTGTINADDLSESVFMASIWTYIEPSMGIISACLPFLSSMLGMMIRGLRAATKGSSIWSLWRPDATTVDRKTGATMLESLTESEVHSHPDHELHPMKTRAKESTRSFV